MSMKSVLLAGVCALTLGSAVQAATLSVDGGWSGFTFGSAGSSWSQSYSFTLSQKAYVLVTDAFYPGDILSVTFAAGPFSFTAYTSSVDTLGANIGDDYTAAWLSEDFSSFSLELGPGSYTVSGKAYVSPYGGGGAAISLVSALPLTVVPLPASGLLLLGGLGLAGAAARRKRKA